MREGKKWNTSPFDVAKEISKSLASNAVSSKVDGVPWDMNRPLEGDCKLELFTFEDDEGRDTFWHSSAHILGEVAFEFAFCTSCCDFVAEIVMWFDVSVRFLLRCQTLEQTYGCRLCIGPCTTRGEVNSSSLFGY